MDTVTLFKHGNRWAVYADGLLGQSLIREFGNVVVRTNLSSEIDDLTARTIVQRNLQSATVVLAMEGRDS